MQPFTGERLNSPRTSSQKTSLRERIRSNKTKQAKKFTIHHLIPILIFLILSIFIFRGIIGVDGEIIHGDFTRPPELDRFLTFFYPMWDEYGSTSTIARLPRLMFYTPFIAVGSLFHLNTTDISVMVFIFCEFLAALSMFYTSRYILKKTYKKTSRKIPLTKAIQCPQCATKVTIFGTSGEKVYVTCPNCTKQGEFYFPGSVYDEENKRYMLSKTISCPNCDTIATISGFPGDTLYITCPTCDEPGVVYFPEPHPESTPDDLTSSHTSLSYASKIYLASFIAGLAYMWSYFLIFNTLWPFIRFAYALAPLIFLTLLIGIEQKKPHYILATGFLWTLATMDVHWIVYGAFLLLSFFLFHFIVETLRSSSYGVVKTLRSSALFHLKYFVLLIGSFLGFSAYWFVPGLLMGGTSRYSALIFTESLVYFYAQSTMINMLSKQASYYVPINAFQSSIESLNTPGMQNFLIMLGLIMFIISLMALIYKHKNRLVIYFSIFALLSLFLASIANLSLDIGAWLMFDAPLNSLYSWAFKTPVISQFVTLALCFLLGFGIIELFIRVDRSKLTGAWLKKGITILVVCGLLFCIILPKWPLATGDLNKFLTPQEMPDEFAQVNTWLGDQDGDFKVLWLPKYRSKEVTWNQNHSTTKDIAGLASSKPTYVFWTPQIQPNAYGIYFLSSTIITLNPDSLVINNATNNLGKLLAPLGIKYIIFHHDNATYWQQEADANKSDILFTHLTYQKDLELVEQFGFISVFENTYFEDHNCSHYFTTTNDFLVYGGLASLSIISKIPHFHPMTDGLIFGNQRQYNPDILNEITDSIIFTKTSGFEDIAFTYVDDKYIIAPFDHSKYGLPQKTWAAIRMGHPSAKKTHIMGNLEEWDWEYDRGIVCTRAQASIKADAQVTSQDRIAHYDFETGINDFSSQTPYLEITGSSESSIGNGCLKGTLTQGDTQQSQLASTSLIPIANDPRYYRVSFYLAAENVNNAQVSIRFFDAQERFLKQKFILTSSGTFDYQQFKQDTSVPSEAKYYSIDILADQNPIAESIWWIDDIKIHDLNKYINPVLLEIPFTVDHTDTYDLFMRYLKGDKGGKINLYIDGELHKSLNTIDYPSAFIWEKISSLPLQKGSHTLAIENIAGFNAVNLFTVTPEAKTIEYAENAQQFLNNKEIIYAFEAESGFYTTNATVSTRHGNTVSSGKILNVSDTGEVWHPIHIAQAGTYTLSMRLAGGRPDYQLNVSIGDISSYFLSNSGSEFIWTDITNIPLTSGNHNLKIAVTPPELTSHFSFENGWNATTGELDTWSSSRPHFTVALDTFEKTDGHTSLKLTTNATGAHNWSRMNSQEIPVEPYSYYKASIDIKTENANYTHVKIQGYNESTDKWEQLDYVVAALKGTHDWKTYSHPLFIPRYISKIFVTLNAGWVRNTSLGNATTWFDNFQLRPDAKGSNFELDLMVLYLNEQRQTLKDILNAAPTAAIVSCEKNDATRYTLKIQATEPFLLGFAEAYDDFWVVHIDGEDPIESIPLYGMLNGFYINKTGEFTVILEFNPQHWFNIGASITGLSLLGFIGYLIWIRRRTRKEQLGALS